MSTFIILLDIKVLNLGVVKKAAESGKRLTFSTTPTNADVDDNQNLF